MKRTAKKKTAKIFIPYVTISSAVYATSRFDYPNERDAKLGYNRLVESAKRWNKKDGITRTIRLILAEETA